MVERNSTKLAQKTLSIDSFIELQHEVFCFVMTSYMGVGGGCWLLILIRREYNRSLWLS